MEKRLGNTMLTITTLVLCVALFSLSVSAVGVRPLVIDLDMKPGETKSFELILTPSDREETVNLSFYEPVQLLNGSLAYQEPTLTSFSSVSWVTLEKDQARVFPGEEVRINGTVRVPFSAGGSHTVVIMVEPEVPTTGQGITFQVRYAVRLNIRVERPGLRQTADLVGLELIPGEKQEPLVRAVVHNTSAWDYLVSGEVTIRDEERRLVERVNLTAQASAGSGANQLRMYPGSQVEFLGEITKRLSPGEYNLRTFIRFGDHGQIVRSETITIAEGDFHFPTADEIGAFSVAPTVIEHRVRAGERKSQVLEFVSEIVESSMITVEMQPVTRDYPYSLVDWVEFRTPTTQFELPGRRTSRLGMTIAVPRDVPDGSYHGNIFVRAHSIEGELLTERIVPISVLVGTNHDYDVDVRSLHAEVVEGVETILSLDITNIGNVPLTPQANIVLTNADGEFVDRAILTLPEGEHTVIPLMSQRLDGSIVELEAGVYGAEITIQNDGQIIALVNRELEVDAD